VSYNLINYVTDNYQLFKRINHMKKFNNRAGTSGFTLVELSIVIVIIGFLVAGIAAGSNMVKQAQLRSVITDIQSFQTAYNGFIGRYNKAPGDLDVASSYWDGTQCAATLANCNGNGDGVISAGPLVAADEAAKAWKHMQLAGFINSGIAIIPDTNAAAFSPGVNAPTSKISGSGFMMVGTTALTRGAGAASIGFGAGSTNYLYLGKIPGTTVTASFTGGSLKPEDAFNLDSKMDDGIVSGTTFSGAESGNFKAVTGTDGTGCQTSGGYTVATTTTACLVGFAVN